MSRYIVTLISCMLLFPRPTGSAETETAPGSGPNAPENPLFSSVVKLHVTIQSPDYDSPWQNQGYGNASGSGFIIGERRILTNAHVVSDSHFIRVQKQDDAERYRARVEFVGHDCDLALITVDDPSFFKDTSIAVFADSMPDLNEVVTVIGYPRGGARLSITRGVVSRIDYSLYSHSARDQHLVLQVDAAINPGNSGGPVVMNDKVVGLAFQALTQAENIGYAIPLPVIRHFLQDIEDGKYDGYPELGAAFLNTRNPAMRADLGLSADKTGVVIYYLDPFGSARGALKTRDVLLAINGKSISNDGSIELDNNTVPFSELLERRQWGESVKFSVWRAGRQEEVAVPLRNPGDPFAYRNIYDEIPEYYVHGGLVFAPLTRPYLLRLRPDSDSPNEQQLVYYTQYAKMDGLYEGKDEFVVLIRILPDRVNTYADDFVNGIVSEVNGKPISRLEDVKEAVQSRATGFHVIKFAGMDNMLVLDAELAAGSDNDILSRYGVASPFHFHESQ